MRFPFDSSVHELLQHATSLAQRDNDGEVSLRHIREALARDNSGITDQIAALRELSYRRAQAAPDTASAACAVETFLTLVRAEEQCRSGAPR